MDCSRFKHLALWIVSNVSQGVKKGEKSQKRERKTEEKIRNKTVLEEQRSFKTLTFRSDTTWVSFFVSFGEHETIGYGGNYG